MPEVPVELDSAPEEEEGELTVKSDFGLLNSEMDLDPVAAGRGG